MSDLDEIKVRVLRWFEESNEKGLNMMNRLLGDEDFSLEEVDALIDAVGKYQAFVICLRQYAKT